jgi:hypothetical protein
MGRLKPRSLKRIRELNPNCEIIAATAGQMIVKSVVLDEASLIES